MIEFVSRTMTFEDLSLEVKVWRFICDKCARRSCFPYEGDGDLEAARKGWKILTGFDDGEQECHCPTCSQPNPANPKPKRRTRG